MYDGEVHFNLTHALAAAAGFDARVDAKTIAVQDVFVDINPKTQPIPRTLSDIGSGANYARLRDWHFVTPERLALLDHRWRRGGSLVKLGIYLHAFQDSFSHRGLGPVTGQVGTYVDENGKVKRSTRVAKKRWHEVDDPSTRPGLALTMAEKTYDVLVEAVGICVKKKTVRRPTFYEKGWAAISGEVGRFCYEPKARTRKHIADRLVARIDQYQEIIRRERRAS